MNFRMTAQSFAPLSEANVAELVKNTCGADCIQVAPQVFQWVSVAPLQADIRDYAQTLHIDLNAIAAHLQWRDLGLLASDMDSTLITVECIDEIADCAGLKPRVAEITERAMRGEIDFSNALRERVALLAGLPESVLAEVYRARVRLTPGAAALIAAAHAVGAKTLLVSGGFTYFTQQLQHALALTDTRANTLGIHDGKLTGQVTSAIVDGEAKAAAVRALRAQLPANTFAIAMGDGANDLPMMAEVDISVAYRAKPRVRQAATVAFNFCGLDAVRQLFPQ
jgi:phosphoserine phosphatase